MSSAQHQGKAARWIAGAMLQRLERPELAAGLILAGLTLALVVVLLDDGTPSAYAHFAYAPTLLAALSFRARGGALVGFLGGMFVGPVAALFLHGHLLFPPEQWTSWGVRTAWITFVGGTLGVLFNYAEAQAHALQWHLLTDPATGRPNRHGAQRDVAGLVQGVRRSHDRDLLVTAVKVTNHEALLGTLGYEGTDRMMRALADRLSGSLPENAVLARTGVNELMMIEAADAATPSEDRVRATRRLVHRTVEVSGMSVYVDAAIGVVRAATAMPSAEELFVQASAAADSARHRPSAVAYYDEQEERARQDSIQLLGDLPRALDNGEIHLAYQPKLCLHTHRFLGVEALVRWDHPTHGAIAPGRFVPLAEDTHIIEDLTRWILRQSLRQLSLWREQGLEPTLAVNVSTRNLASGSLLAYLSDLIHEHLVPPGRLELEITESAFTTIHAEHIEFLQEFRDIGARIAIDDFGSGYASLGYLRELPMDTLKIDRTFVRGLVDRSREKKIFRRIIQLARDLDLRVVGEGVEDEAALEALRELGCDEAQGYLFARPQPAETLQPLLTAPWRGASGRPAGRG